MQGEATSMQGEVVRAAEATSMQGEVVRAIDDLKTTVHGVADLGLLKEICLPSGDDVNKLMMEWVGDTRSSPRSDKQAGLSRASRQSDKHAGRSRQSHRRLKDHRSARRERWASRSPCGSPGPPRAERSS